MVRAKTVLDKYYIDGYLNLIDSHFSAKDRYRAGSRLSLEYYLGYTGALKSHNFVGINQGKINQNLTAFSFNERAVYYRSRFHEAKKSVPYEFWPAVFEVCIKDHLLSGHYKNQLQNKNDVYSQKILLCLGLDRLIRHYLRSDDDV